jgi:hypothetical protein
MKLGIMVATALTTVVIGGAAIWAVANGRLSTCSGGASSCEPAAGETGARSAAVENASGKVLGHFDLAMAGCRFACATQREYDAESVVAQPGARDGHLTRCPVSGVVFNVDSNRPRVMVGADDYVTCCDRCAEKLRKNSRRFVRV